MDRERFSGKSIVITGGAKGIGRAIAVRFAEEGAKNIIITSSRDAHETSLTLDMVKKIGANVFAIVCNVADEESVRAFFETVKKEVGHIDHIVHSAGISPNTQFFDQTAAEWNHVLSTNVTGSFSVIKHGASLLPDYGSITLISSTNGINSNAPYSAHYDSSKAGVDMLVKNAAEQLKDRHIRVNAIAPGWIDTELNNTLPPGEKEAETAKIFAGRFAEPSEIASVASFLASKDASYINGAILMVDGGYRG